MLPMKRLSTSPYAMNAGLLGGLSSAQFIQLGQGVQADASTNSALFINKTASGNLVQLQSGGNDAFTLSNSGDLTFGANADHTLSVATAGAGAAGKSLTISAGAAGTGASALAGGNLTVQAGAGGGTNGNGGNLTIDAGLANGTGTNGTISIGTSNASAITIGSASQNGPVTTQAAGISETLTGSGTAPSLVVKTTTNSTSAFQVQNTSGYTELKVDTSGNMVTIGNVTTTAGQGVQGLLALADGTNDGFAVSLQTNGAITSNRLIYLPDEAGTICLRNSSNCGFVSGSGGANFINNGTSVQNAANFYIRSAAVGSVGGVIEGANGQTADLLEFNTYNGTTSTTVAKFTNAGNLSFQQASTISTSAGNLSLQSGTGSINLTVSQTGTGVTVQTATNNSTAALQVQNSSGNRVFGVDTVNSQAILGQSNLINGSLIFKNSSNANGVTLNSTSANASYTLTLPSSAPAAGLCIETSSGNANQLIFASCTNNNASIQEVHEWDANNTNVISVSPTTIGDEIVLTTQIPTGGVTVTGVSGGGVNTWTKAVVSAGNGTVNRVEMWVGTVTATGNSNITVTYSSSPGSEEITATEFTAAGVNASTSWGIESAASQLNSTSSTNFNFPNMTAVNGSELYVGYGQVQNPPATAGSTTGFNYIVTSTQHNVITYNPSLAANTSYQPSANQNSAGQSNTVAAVLTAFVTSTSINNTTSLQKANFYVQAASSGTVAGVLQAASSGTADVMDIRDSSANNVLAVGYTGNLTLKPAASTTAFQVQNGSSQGVLTVDTSNNKVMLGSSNNIAGLLTFADPGDANTISLSAPTTIAASYTLSLPNNAPTAGLCLGTSPSNANQLIFASCATQVSAAAITYVNQWSNSGTSVTTLADSPASNGNLLVLYSHSTNNVSITGISGGGVTNWTKVTSNVGGAGQGNDEMWRGVVTGTGSGTITVTYSAAAGANEITAQEYTMGGTGGGTWAIDTSGATTGSSATINYPSITPANSSELYAGYAWSQNTMSAGSTTGYTYVATSSGKYTAYDTNVTGGTVQQPTASQSVAGNFNSIAALIQAYAGTSVIVNSTAAQQANFNVQAATAGTVAGVLQGASSGGADIFQAKDSNGNNILSANATSGTTLGAAGAVTGQLVFANSGNSNTITLNAPSNVGTNYTLTLPTASPAAGQCLAAGAANPNQLVFSSCANQVTSVAISYVNNWKASGNAITTLSVSPTNVGDLMTFFSSPNSATSVASVSGGGVTTWTKVTGIEMWRGIVTTAGAATITVTYNNPAGNPNELAAMEFTTGSASGSWVVDASSAQYNSTASTTVTYPSLTPQSTKDLYVGYGSTGSTMSAGSSTGFTYLAGSLTSREGLYNNSVSATTQPTATQSSSGTSITVGALIAAYSSSSVIANSTVTQQANINVQAGFANSVAATFQAAQSGTADVMQILDISGNVVDSFSNTGNLLVKPSTASSSAFRVQTTGAANVLSADTSNLRVVIGAGSTGESTPALLVLDNETGTTADPSELDGAMYYNATTRSFRCGVAGAWQNCNGLLYSNTSNSSANNNCSNNCAAFSTNASLPANYCQPGRVIKLSAAGYFSSLATPSNIQFGVYYGTDGSVAANDTLLGTLPPAATVASASNNAFLINFNILCFSTTTMQTGGILNIQTGAASSGMTGLPMASTNGTTVVSSSTKNLYIFPIWDTASTSNTATLTQFEATGL
jgi:hypothetical protein